MKKGLAALLALFFLLTVVSPGISADDRRKIRVGYPIQSGMSEIGSDGDYQGYTYEYLQEIAQYTGWAYEFVPIPEEDAPVPLLMDMLEQGHIDLLGPLTPTASNMERFSFPGYSYGTSYSALYVLDENKVLNETNYQEVNGMRIAVQKNSSMQISNLQNFFASNSIDAKLVYCEDESTLVEAVRTGQADALLGTDAALFDGMRIIAKFAPTPFYFATTKGNASIISSLNLSIQKINVSDPYFSARLYEKYFSQKPDHVFLSESEKEYIRLRAPIQVEVIPDRAPFQSFTDSDEFVGVTRTVLDSIAAQTGLRFEFFPAGTGQPNQTYDLLAGVPYDYQLAEQYNFSMTRPFAQSQIVMISNRSMDNGNLAEKRLVMPQGLYIESHNGSEVVRKRSVWECIAAVNSGEADYSFANGYTASYYTNQGIYKNIILTPQTGMEQQICLGVMKPVDVDLLTILNKCILSMVNDGTIQTILYAHTAPIRNQFSVSFLIANYPTQCFLVFALAAGLILGAVVWGVRVRAKADKMLALTGERYMMLAEVSNEYLFEYDYGADKLSLSPKLAFLFGCRQLLPNWRQNAEFSGDILSYDPAGLLNHQTKKDKFDRELLLPLPDKARCWFRLVGITLYNRNDTPAYLVGKLTNVQKEMEEKGYLLEKSQRDGLTGVYNASTSRELISSYLENRPEREAAALLIADVDSFKSVNDILGHYVGDEVLKDVAARFHSQVRKTDIVGRLGGDEFIILMKNVTGRDAVLRKGDELCAAIRKSVRGNGQELLITVSIGCVMAEPGLDFDALYRKADQALYTVKRLGKDRFYLCAASDGGNAASE